MVMRRAFPRHPGSGLLLVVAGRCIRRVNVENIGHMHSGVALCMGNGGRNRAAEQHGQN